MVGTPGTGKWSTTLGIWQILPQVSPVPPSLTHLSCKQRMAPSIWWSMPAPLMWDLCGAIKWGVRVQGLMHRDGYLWQREPPVRQRPPPKAAIPTMWTSTMPLLDKPCRSMERMLYSTPSVRQLTTSKPVYGWTHG